ncbi:spermidine hydroxycinnamoyl transferase-like [Impatiens glandulifera]|uniref:spermidine hydroxycinnamoyl transferase-like n=1 Tax=Impatiens glandulifera TaxID=253017 RepID=UPI001FB0F2C9|nr:spermidine hydroxycinnamoyl transferase-like [Impatiens glandulifera]
MLTVKASHLIKPAVKTPSGYMFLPENDQFMPITHGTQNPHYFPPISRPPPLSLPNPRFQLNLNSAGALLLEAESTKKVEDFGDFCPTPEIRQLIPSVDYTRPIHEIPLLIVQITKFKCGAVSLGLGFHTVVDGRAMLHFISEWARISRGESPSIFLFLTGLF